MAAVVFEPRIRAGGFNADDWALYSAFRFPQAAGFHNALGALEHSAGSRVGHMLYWFASFSIFGSHTRLYSATAGMLAVALAFTVYLFLRELKFSLVHSLAIMLLTIVAPSIDAVRFWFTPAGIQISIILVLIGMMLALRAFVAPEGKRISLHALSWGFYLASAIYTETALPLIAVGLLVYLTRAPFLAALRRWGCDLVIVVIGYSATLSFVDSQPGFSKLPASMWWEHARLIGDQSLTIFTQLLFPIPAGDRSIILIGTAVILTAGLTLWSRDDLPDSSRRTLRRWIVALGISLTAIVAGYVVFVPAMLYYEPLGPGLATHINAVTAVPLAVAIFAVLMIAQIVVAELIGSRRRHVGTMALAVVTVWYAAIVIDAGNDVRSNAHIWALASERDDHVLHVLRQDLSNPVSNATIYTFGEAGTVAPGLPIFFTSWELNNAIKIEYNRPDLSAFPVVTNGIHPVCAPKGIIASVESTPVSAASLYGRSYFMDIANGKYAIIKNMAACTAALSRLPVGAYSYASREWED
ncbi:MAG TPA: hypothetical protein VIJ50_03375 [Solirubrobacteraceae bacterium]